MIGVISTICSRANIFHSRQCGEHPLMSLSILLNPFHSDGVVMFPLLLFSTKIIKNTGNTWGNFPLNILDTFSI